MDLSGDGHSDYGEVIPQCCFDCLDLIISHVEYVSVCFMILYSVSIVYLLKLASFEHRPCFEYFFW